MGLLWLTILTICNSQTGLPAARLESPVSARRFEVAEFVLTIPDPDFANPFVDAELSGEFHCENSPTVTAHGFVDAQDGRIMRLRFCPDRADVNYEWQIALKAREQTRTWTGNLRCNASNLPGPVIVNPDHPKHFIYAGSRQPFFHLGTTAYHLLDITNDERQIDAMIDYCKKNGFNKIRFLLTGYPRDTDKRTSHDNENGVIDPNKAPNYGAKPGQVNPLPAWLGQPHHYDFSRFNVEYWQKADSAVRSLHKAGIVATCIFTIEKQNLPKEYGALTPAEYRLYSYAIARLSAFDNVWWDLGNEHNEYRDRKWGQTMGAFVKKEDPYQRLLSAHAYQEFLYPRAPWADFIITQQYGYEDAMYAWAMKYEKVPKPYVDEEYGYENDGGLGPNGKPYPPGHGQSADLCRHGAWAVAMAGGYVTYGDSSGGVAYYYMGEPGPGKAASQLKLMREFFEALPFQELIPAPTRTSSGFCLARAPDCFVFYFPRGGTSKIDLTGGGVSLDSRWFNPKLGEWQPGPTVSNQTTEVVAPDQADWVLLVRTRASSRQSG